MRSRVGMLDRVRVHTNGTGLVVIDPQIFPVAHQQPHILAELH